VLLAGILGAIALAGCEDDKPTHTYTLSYRPGADRPDFQGPVPMPELPCLPIGDSRLDVLNPGCRLDFRLAAGPTEETDAEGKTICVYTAEDAGSSGCIVGRPLTGTATGEAIVARTVRGAWA
jgi:hypothetical protein